jgi:3-methyladenine DNA glycosylase AlkD
MLQELKIDLKSLTDPEKAAFFPRFFKTGKGQYGEGDKFIGVTVPNQRKVAKQYRDLKKSDLKKLLYSKIHEHRLTALFILVSQYERSDEQGKREAYDFYLKHKAQVNNWDLVDSSSHKIVGAYLLQRDKLILTSLARSKSLWDRRIAMISTFWFLKNGQPEACIKIAEILVNDSHDLMHKAVGWMLRELGKIDLEMEEAFLKRHHKTMPRTMLRYAIERFPETKRQFYLRH